ncbi:UNVERIFIED_ORG: hypothetical protein FNL38_10593 [Nocardia globerula]|uniref:Uncharacterized protein n=1 Tax=Nocardia globerula TaxID=1818 RepID=A0A652YM50_NOCGL|nr:hypothetical protein C8E04_3066 [Rhodococcus globerulus]
MFIFASSTLSTVPDPASRDSHPCQRGLFVVFLSSTWLITDMRGS